MEKRVQRPVAMGEQRAGVGQEPPRQLGSAEAAEALAGHRPLSVRPEELAAEPFGVGRSGVGCAPCWAHGRLPATLDVLVGE